MSIVHIIFEFKLLCMRLKAVRILQLLNQITEWKRITSNFAMSGSGSYSSISRGHSRIMKRLSYEEMWAKSAKSHSYWCYLSNLNTASVVLVLEYATQCSTHSAPAQWLGCCVIRNGLAIYVHISRCMYLGCSLRIVISPGHSSERRVHALVIEESKLNNNHMQPRVDSKSIRAGALSLAACCCGSLVYHIYFI